MTVAPGPGAYGPIVRWDAAISRLIKIHFAASVTGLCASAALVLLAPAALAAPAQASVIGPLSATGISGRTGGSPG